MNLEYSELIWLDERHEVSLDELAALSGFTKEELQHLVESGALTPNNLTEGTWQFNSYHIVSVRTLSRLKQDFELEPNALALTLVFLERIRKLESQLKERG
jgi:chaperone modulatory protein CbpM